VECSTSIIEKRPDDGISRHYAQDGLDTTWQYFITSAIEAGVISREQRFTLHGLKHRGITDTVGKKAEKKEASGHKSDAMLELYDHEVAVVEPARPGEA
jgi:hypothetical protein